MWLLKPGEAGQGRKTVLGKIYPSEKYNDYSCVICLLNLKQGRMKQYYLHNGQHLVGPFTSDELREKNITRETFVWKEDQNDWIKANEIPALVNIFADTVPQFRAEYLAVNIFRKQIQKK
jgi:hypothetical protein